MLVLAFLLCVVYSSFSFPGLMAEAGTEYGLSSVSEEAQNIELAEEADIDFSRIEFFAERDMLQEMYYLDGFQSMGTGEDRGEDHSQGAGQDKAGQDGASKEPAEEHRFSADDWRLILVNPQHSIPEDYEVILGNVGTMKNTMQCDERIIEDWLAMQKAAEKDGVKLLICSPYRDLAYQKLLFNRKIKLYMNQGLSYMEAYQLGSKVVNVPNASEHQIGLALDIVTPSYTMLEEGFADTPAGKWLAENSYRFGFILRYPKGKENITGIIYEPWHFRYVGEEAATVITEEGLTLEEFWEEYL